MSLILVGVVHKDPDGYDRLSGLLESLQPEAITVELSPLGLLWRETRGRGLLGALDSLGRRLSLADPRGHLELVSEGLKVPFEFTASLAYSERHGAALHLLDLNWVSLRHLPLYESEVLTEENLMLLGEVPSARVRVVVERAYRRAARCLAEGPGRWEKETAIWEEATGRQRERLFACRLRRLAQRYEGLIHVGGWVHLIQDHEGLSLANLLRDLSPARILLEGGDGPLALPSMNTDNEIKVAEALLA